MRACARARKKGTAVGLRVRGRVRVRVRAREKSVSKEGVKERGHACENGKRSLRRKGVKNAPT